MLQQQHPCILSMCFQARTFQGEVLVKCSGSKAAHSRQHATHDFGRGSVYRMPAPKCHLAYDAIHSFNFDVSKYIIAIPASLGIIRKLGRSQTPMVHTWGNAVSELTQGEFLMVGI